MEQVEKWATEFITDINVWLALLIGLIPWAKGKLLSIWVEKKVYKWLKSNTENKDGKRFRSTNAICNGINVSPEKVLKACYSSKRIRRNELENETWTIFSKKEESKDIGFVGVDLGDFP